MLEMKIVRPQWHENVRTNTITLVHLPQSRSTLCKCISLRQRISAAFLIYRKAGAVARPPL